MSLQRDGESVGPAVHLEVVLPAVPQQQAEEPARLAHQGRPCSKATRGDIGVRITVSDE